MLPNPMETFRTSPGRRQSTGSRRCFTKTAGLRCPTSNLLRKMQSSDSILSFPLLRRNLSPHCPVRKTPPCPRISTFETCGFQWWTRCYLKLPSKLPGQSCQKETPEYPALRIAYTLMGPKLLRRQTTQKVPALCGPFAVSRLGTARTAGRTMLHLVQVFHAVSRRAATPFRFKAYCRQRFAAPRRSTFLPTLLRPAQTSRLRRSLVDRWP